MRSLSRVLTAVLLAAFSMLSCVKKEPVQAEPFAFVVYPGAHYLGPLTDLFKKSRSIIVPNEADPPPTALYDTDAPLEEVANFYARSYGFSAVAQDTTNNLSAAKPPAFYRNGDLATDVRSIADVLKKMNVNTDVSKAAGSYRAAEIEARPNRPQVTVQRPYFDVINSQVVDRTLILMTRP